jgi:hypothetical protein
LPKNVDAVFVTTPDTTHCDVASYWLGRARWVFVEKPFDASARRVAQFCRELVGQGVTQVFAVDHYFVRCNQAAADEKYFLGRLLTPDSGRAPQGDVTRFEFSMTEPPLKDERGNYDPRPARERALSLQTGMVFDLGAHALPVLQPFIDLTKPMELTEVWAGVSEGLRGILFSGAESFSIATVQGSTRPATGKPSGPIEGKFILGKDVGAKPAKYLWLEGPGGKLRFDLVNYHVYHERVSGDTEPVAPLQQNWAQFFVKEVLEGRLPKAIELFRPEGALGVVEFLERWRAACRPRGGGGRRPLRVYEPGAPVADLMNDGFRTLRRGQV